MRRTVIAALAIVAPLTALAQDISSEITALQTERLRALDFAPFLEVQEGFQSTPEQDAQIIGADIPALQAALADGSLTSETLTLWHLSRIARLDDGLRSYLELNPAALEEARAADARRAAGQFLGPLDGIPVSLKDNIGTAGPMHTTANAEVLLDNVAEADASLVANLRAAGAVILGKASLSEFAGVIASGYPSGGNGAIAGQTVNPLGPYPTFGSSAGSAVGVAAHLAVVSVGTETSGSLIAPASVMSLVGMKPSAGGVSGEGVIPLVLNNDSAGPIARSVMDAALLLEVIDTTDVPYTAGLSTGALDGVSVGVMAADISAAGPYGDQLSRVGATLAILGADMHPVTLSDPTGAVDAIILLISTGIRLDMMPYITARHPDLVTPEDLIAYNAANAARRAPFGQNLIEAIAPMSLDLTLADHQDMALQMTAAAGAALEAAFATAGAEVLVSMNNTHSSYYATAGYPAITVPMGRDSTGQPSGVTLIGRQGADARLLAFAFALEQATRARIMPDVD
jgi:amidase